MVVWRVVAGCRWAAVEQGVPAGDSFFRIYTGLIYGRRCKFDGGNSPNSRRWTFIKNLEAGGKAPEYIAYSMQPYRSSKHHPQVLFQFNSTLLLFSLCAAPHLTSHTLQLSALVSGGSGRDLPCRSASADGAVEGSLRRTYLCELVSCRREAT